MRLMSYETDRRYGNPYHGLTALQSGVLVAFTQIIPEHQIQLFGVIKARVKVSSPMPAHVDVR